jgi:hypothetical protein
MFSGDRKSLCISLSKRKETSGGVKRKKFSARPVTGVKPGT